VELFAFVGVKEMEKNPFRRLFEPENSAVHRYQKSDDVIVARLKGLFVFGLSVHGHFYDGGPLAYRTTEWILT
jgi:hypothetical protein